MRTDPLFALVAFLMPQFAPTEWFKATPGAVMGFFFAMWVVGWLWVQVGRPLYLKRNGNSKDERRTNAAKLMNCVQDIHDVVTLSADPLGDPTGRKAVYGLEPELVRRLASALEVNQAVLTELEAHRGMQAKVERRLGAIEQYMERKAS